jgi:hypothetical protein
VDAGQTPFRRVGLGLLLAGIVAWVGVVVLWLRSHMGPLHAVPVLSLGTTLLVTGAELVGATFLIHVMGLRRQR